MSGVRVSVVIPTYNRPDKVRATVRTLYRQELSGAGYELLVVDNGSTPPVELPEAPPTIQQRLIRLERPGRSNARNAGARAAGGSLLVFLDDDISVRPDFLAAHQQAQEEWPGCLAVGAIRLPDGEQSRPFVRFRQALEDASCPPTRGLVGAANFCAAGNMSIPRDRFLDLGGFDVTMSSSEDQDLGLRHSAAGGRIAYLPEAVAVHHDHALDVRSYCRRMEWGYRQMLPFCRRYPERADNIERHRLNGPLDWRVDGLRGGLRKLAKSALGLPPTTAALFTLCDLLERTAPNGRLLDRLYRAALGVHIFRGYRQGLRQYASLDIAADVPAVALGPRQVT